MKQFDNKYIIHTLLIANNDLKKNDIFKLEKITLHFGIKDAVTNEKKILLAGLALNIISKSASVFTKANKPLLNFKIRQGMPVGCKVTLRNVCMHTFLNLLIAKELNTIQLKDSRTVLLQKNISFSIYDLFEFPMLESFFEIFNKLPLLNITISTNSIDTLKKFNFLRLYNFNIDLVE